MQETVGFGKIIMEDIILMSLAQKSVFWPGPAFLDCRFWLHGEMLNEVLSLSERYPPAFVVSGAWPSLSLRNFEGEGETIRGPASTPTFWYTLFCTLLSSNLIYLGDCSKSGAD